MLEKKNLISSHVMKMRWGEMDTLGHMNNVSYYRYFEEGRVSWFDKIKVSYRQGGQGPILGTTTCRFLKPAIYPLTFELKTYVGKPGHSSFVMWQDLFLHNNPKVKFAEAESVLVWIDINEGKSLRMPDWLRQKVLN